MIPTGNDEIFYFGPSGVSPFGDFDPRFRESEKQGQKNTRKTDSPLFFEEIEKQLLDGASQDPNSGPPEIDPPPKSGDPKSGPPPEISKSVYYRSRKRLCTLSEFLV